MSLRWRISFVLGESSLLAEIGKIRPSELTFYIPTHRDEAAMNGAPDLQWH